MTTDLTWEDLFDRATAYDTTIEEIRETLADHRASESRDQ